MEENGVCAGAVSLREMHEMHHLGLDRSLYVARKVDPMVTRQSVQRVVKGCERCQRIDPAPMVHEGGEIWVTGNWRRLAVDVTHYQGGGLLVCGGLRTRPDCDLETTQAGVGR